MHGKLSLGVLQNGEDSTSISQLHTKKISKSSLIRVSFPCQKVDYGVTLCILTVELSDGGP